MLKFFKEIPSICAKRGCDRVLGKADRLFVCRKISDMTAFCNFFITSLRAFRTIILPSVIYHSIDKLFVFKVDTKFLTRPSLMMNV